MLAGVAEGPRLGFFANASVDEAAYVSSRHAAAMIHTRRTFGPFLDKDFWCRPLRRQLSEFPNSWGDIAQVLARNPLGFLPPVLAVAHHGYRKSGSSGHVDRYTLRACEEAMS